MVEVIVIEEGHYAGQEKTIAVLKLARVPVKGDYLVINKQRYTVASVEFRDSGEIVVTVE